MDYTMNGPLLDELPVGACEIAKPPRRTSGSLSSTTTIHHHGHPITTDSIRPLKTCISTGHFPDDLLVHGYVGSVSQPTVHYSRVYPVFPRDSTGFPNGKRGRMRKSFAASSRNVAHLYLTSAVTLDSGMHTTILRAPLSLPLPSEDGSPVTVVVKLAHQVCGAHQRLMEEAALFNAISPLFDEDLPYSRPESSSDHDGSGENTGSGDTSNVPKFYGFYLPVRKDGSMRFRAHAEGCDEGCQREVQWMTPILLLEESAETVVAD
ncbi:hypothetical protein C8T65DRAFT_33812 [Cerioporus squamosus]|nr:hypothetical protein C8T65DRAFT_33812 [Cerioporus squamosus]